MWKKINFNTVFSEKKELFEEKIRVKNVLKSIKTGGLEPNNLKNNLKKHINLNNFYNSKIDYGLTTVSYPKLKAINLTKKEIKKEDLIDYIVASSTVYPFFKLQEIENNKYVDGGFKNPLPVDLAIKLGIDKLIIVNISYFKKKAKVDKKTIKKYNPIIIKPNNNLGNPLNFNAIQSKKNICYGYNDTMKVYKKLYGKSYTFRNISKYYKENDYFKDEKEYINILEYLGKKLKIDDTKIYSIKKYNQELEKKLNIISYKEVKTGKQLKKGLSPNERIKFIYTKIINQEIKTLNRLKKQFYKDYMSAYYLYKNQEKQKEQIAI